MVLTIVTMFIFLFYVIYHFSFVIPREEKFWHDGGMYMAFINNLGMAISFDCSDLIEELKEDIDEFGEDLTLEVVTEEMEGVTIYKDYHFIGDDMGEKVSLSEGEHLQKITAVDLLMMYERENGIL